MRTRKFLIFISLVLALVSLSWGINQAGAQVVVPPGAAGFNPAVNYNLPNFSYSPNIRKFVDALPGLGAAGCTVSTPAGTGTCNENDLGQYIPVAVPNTTTFSGDEYYELGAVQYSRKLHSDLPATKLRGYRQENATDSKIQNVSQYLGPIIIARTYDPTRPKGVNGNGRPVRVLIKNELPLTNAGPANQFFLPVDRNLMGTHTGPTGGVFFTDNRISTHLHGGATPWISDGTPNQWMTPANEPSVAGQLLYQKGASFANVPDMVTGSSYPGPGNPSAPVFAAQPCIGGDTCFAPSGTDGKETKYYSNEQSARLMFYHDHAYGITRLNVYAGMAAPYLLVDQVEDDLIVGSNTSRAFSAPTKVLPNLGGVYKYGIPLVIQDKSFVNDNSTPPGAGFTGTPTDKTATTDPLWIDSAHTWLGATPPAGGNLWLPHEYMPNQDIYDPSGANPLGRWDYGPWLNPPAIPLNANLPSPTITPEAFVDTMVVNGTPFPYVNVPAGPVRFRILNACNDRTLNLSIFQSDPAAPTEVRMVPAAPNPAAPTWPVDGRNGGVPDPTLLGPTMYQIGNEGGLLPQVAVVPPQPVVFEQSRLLPTVLGIAKHALLIMPAVRADIVVDFSAFAGKTLILYNDAPAASPLFDERYEVYTNGPDMRSTGGAPPSTPGFGPNTRTVMQIRVAAAPGTPLNLAALQAALPQAYKATQARPIVPQTAYNAAFPGLTASDYFVNNTDATINLTGTGQVVAKVVTTLGGSGYTTAPAVNFVTADGTGAGATATAFLNGVTAITVTGGGVGYTSAPTVTITPVAPDTALSITNPASAVASVSGGVVTAVVVSDPGSGYTVNPTIGFTGGGATTAATATAGITLGAVAHITITSPGSGYRKAPFVYLTGGGGTGATADSLLVGDQVVGSKNITEGFDVEYGRLNVLLGTTPVPLDPFTPAPAVPGIARYIDPPSDLWNDGQPYIFRLTHLGVDNHAVHFHLVNLQLVNRVDFTNTMLPPEPDELGWKETIRTEPFTDLILATKPKAMVLPFTLPRSNRLLDTTTLVNSTANFVQPAPTPGLPNPAGISNVVTDYGWEYVWHCHLLGHEENDMMRPIIFNPPGSFSTATGLTVTPNVASPHANGTTVSFTANGTGSVDPSGSANIYYQYRYYMDGVAQFNAADATNGYNGNPTFSLPLYLAPGVHTVAADVRTNFTSATPDQSTFGTPLSYTVTNGRDFNSDGQTDILWRDPATGENLIWKMNGTTYSSNIPLPAVAPPWQIVGIGDFTGGGQPDILWRDPTTGENVIWNMNGSTVSGIIPLPTVASPWQIEGVGDFSSKGQPDILWRDTSTGDVVIWYMNGTTLSSVASIGNGGTPWQIAGVGDFNGDGLPDILWRNPLTGENIVWYMNGVNTTSSAHLPTVAPPWQIVGVADYNGDGKPDILWRDDSTGDNAVWIMNGSTKGATIFLPNADPAWQIVGR